MKISIQTILWLCCLLIPVYSAYSTGGAWVNQPGQKNYNLSNYEVKPEDGSLPQAAKQFLTNYLEDFATPNASLALAHKRKSPMGHHLTFVQAFQGVPVYGSEVKLNLSKDYKILSLYHKTLSTEDWRIRPFNRNAFDSLLRAENAYPAAIDRSQEVIFYDEGKAQSALKVRLTDGQASVPKEVVFSQSAEVLYEKELARNAAPDTTLNGYVFLPDPLTTAETTYGSPYANANDANNQALNDERKMVPIAINQTNPDTFFLNGPNAEIVDHSFPTNSPAFTTGDAFAYKRAAPQFEEVNVYYHIQNLATYIQEALNLEALGKYQIQADAHGLSGDNSTFLMTGDSTGRLSFGDGGVDDGEDADIVAHEYAHALSYHAEPNFPAEQGESEALEEGIADYLACSYSRNMNEFGWERLFNWDGHNEFWNGRACTTDMQYPEDLNQGSIYHGGTLWAGTMMEVWEKLGREVTDRLMLTTLYTYASTMSMKDAAKQILLADEILYQQKHRPQIVDVFENAGFIDHTGIKEKHGKGRDIKVYNAGDVFKVETRGASEVWGIQLQTINGKVLGKWRPEASDNFEIRHSHLAQGVYLISVYTQQASESFRVVK